MLKSRFFLLTAVSVAMFFPSGESSAKKKPVYKDKNAPVEERVEDLLGRMTLREKVLHIGYHVC